MRLVFAGTPQPAVPALARLVESDRHEVVGVLTRPDARAGRGKLVRRSPVGELADAHGIPVLTPVRVGDVIDELRELAPECIPVVAYGLFVASSALDLAPLGWVNLHFSLLPAWRGAAPVQASIRAGDEVTGATTFRLESGMDTGPVFGVVTETVRSDDTAGALLERLSVSGAELMSATMDGLAAGELHATPQPADGVSLAPKITVEDARVEWHRPALAVDRMIRSLTPAPGAWTTVGEQRVKIGPVVITDTDDVEPGRIVVERDGVLVGTAGPAVRLGTVQPQGRAAMPAADWARGARLSADAAAGGSSEL